MGSIRCAPDSAARCPSCGFSPTPLTVDDALRAIRGATSQILRTIRIREQATPPADGEWSAFDHVGHLRDVLLTARTQALHARYHAPEPASPIVPNPDELVSSGEYRHLTTQRAVNEISQAAEWLTQTWRLLEPATIPVEVFAQHAGDTIHELMHHHQAILDATELQKTFSLSPDFGSPWGLWSSNPPYPDAPTDGGLLTPDSFGFSTTIAERLRAWIDDWNANFADAPADDRYTWRHGFDVGGWIREGDAITDLMVDELPDYSVERTYRRYRMNAFRSPSYWRGVRHANRAPDPEAPT